MSDSGLSSGHGYQPPKNLLGDFTLKLDPLFLTSNVGWHAQRPGQPHPVSLGSLLPNGLDHALSLPLGGFSRGMAGSGTGNPGQLLASNFQAGPGIPWDKLLEFVSDRVKSAVWRDLSIRGTRDIVTGKPVTIGKWDAAGMARPDGVDETTVAGGALDTRKLSAIGLGKGAISLGRRFRFASDADVSLLLFVDTNAYPDKPAWLFSGGGVNFQRKSGDGRLWNLKLGGGRDQAGGLGVFGVISLSPGD